jgi:WD40 repeat protein
MNVETTRVAVSKLLITPDNSYLIGGDVFGSLSIWNLNDGTIGRFNTKDNDPKGLAMSLSPDGKLLAIASIGKIQLYDLSANEFLSNIRIPSDKDYSYTVSAVAFSNDGALLAAGLDNGAIYVFRTVDFAPILHFQGHLTSNYDGVLSLAFSPDNKILASGGYDGMVKIWGINK